MSLTYAWGLFTGLFLLHTEDGICRVQTNKLREALANFPQNSSFLKFCTSGFTPQFGT